VLFVTENFHNHDSGIIYMQNNFSCQLPRTVAILSSGGLALAIPWRIQT